LGLGAAPRAYPAILPAQKALPNQVSSISCP
jgi:hypothetical protein